MYRNSRKIFKKLKRIILLFLMIYIAGCTSITKYNECKEECKLLQDNINDNKIVIENLECNIESIEKEKLDLENVLDFYSISNYKLLNKNNMKEVIYIRKCDILEISTDLLKINKDFKNKVSEVSTFIRNDYKLYPDKIVLTIDDEYTNVCLYYYIKDTDNLFDITIYIDLSVTASSKNNTNKILTLSKKINNLNDLDKFLIPLLKIF